MTAKQVILLITGLIAVSVGGMAYVQKRRREKYQTVAINAERDLGLPPGLLIAMAETESAWDPRAVSPAGAIGIMQIIPKWHPGVDPWNPIASIQYAGKYIKNLYHKYGNYTLALAAYNWGPGNLDRQGWINAPEETRQYVKKITSMTGLA